MSEWEEILSGNNGPSEDLMQGQTPSPPPHLPERPNSESWQDVIKGFTPPPPPALPNNPLASASSPNSSSSQDEGNGASAQTAVSNKPK